MPRPRKRWRRIAVRAVVAIALVYGVDKAWTAYRPLPKPTRGDALRGEWAFTESDLGSKNYASLPRAVFDALPEIFPDLFVEGWAGLGFISRPEDPDGPPVGMVRVSVLGVETYASNCAICHAGRIGDKTIIGAPNANLNVQRISYFVFTALRRDELTVDAIADVATKKGKPLGALDRQSVRLWLGIARRRLAGKSTAWFKDELGPGRSDALNGWKRVLGVPEGSYRSWVDIPSIYNQRDKKQMLLDGSVTGDPAVRVTMTELEKGRPPRDTLLHREVFDDLVAYMNERIAPPRFPWPVDGALAARGHVVFGESCSGCHGTYAPDPRTYPNKRVRSGQIGTDPERALAMTKSMGEPLSRYGYDELVHIDPQPAYVAPPLDGVWATAPYLHNGSVPTLWHLLQEESKRPRSFWRGFNQFDAARVGFVCAETELSCALDSDQRKHDPRVIFRFDATKPGNLNTGHAFGTSLSDPDKLALVEYLKTI